MADNSPYSHSYVPLHNEDDGDEPSPPQSPPGKDSYQQPHSQTGEMAEVEKAQEATGAPVYSLPNPTPGQAYNQQTQPPPQQLLTVQAQPPPPQTGGQYYTQPYPAQQLVLAQPQMPLVATQQTLTRPTDTSTNLPKYAFVTSVVLTATFTVLFWLPGLLCLVPAIVMSIMALNKKENNKLKEAKRFSIASFILVLIFAVSYPILVTTVILASVFGYICDYQYKEQLRQNYYYGSYYYYYPSKNAVCG